ncbi:hypothetical protein BGZ54_006369 [Gamsiella multidivaricata]|nr:hypothetical protein BGZ54_006369 [Gamsiella multidivaricata]
MLPSIASRRSLLLSQPLLGMRTMATKTYVVKAKDAASSAKTTATYVSKATRATAAKTPGSNVMPAYTKSDFSTTRETSSSFSPKTFSASPVSAAAASSSSPPPSVYSDYSDDDVPSEVLAKIGGATSQQPGEVFSTGTSSLKDAVMGDHGNEDGQDWTRSFAGMATEPFEREVAELLMSPLDSDDIEVKPDGLLYLPEIKYRRILNKAFGPGGWGLAPRSEHSISPKTISREYALICRGRFVSTARGEQDYFDPNNLATATEGCKSNALMRCCKDLGIASELWDPSFIRKFKKQHCEEVFVENVVTKKKKKLWRRKDGADFEYPWAKAK